MPDSLGLISFVGGGDGYCVLASGPDGSELLRWSPEGSSLATSRADAEVGRATLQADDGDVEIAWSPAGPMLEFGIGEQGIRAYAVAASASGSVAEMSGPGVAWELPAEGFSALRTIWAATDEGGLTLLVSARAEGGASHEDEAVGAARLIPGAEPYGYVEPLLSTEYDGAGAHVRATLELWAGDEEPTPERGGGLRVGGAALETSAGRLEAARYAWKLGGAQAVGGYEILVP